MDKIKIEMKGVGVELVLGSYMPTDSTILKNWEEFFHYNDLIHESCLLADYVKECVIWKNDTIIYQNVLGNDMFQTQKSILPVMRQDELYLRTECAENAEYVVRFETEKFDIQLLTFMTQDFYGLFSTGKSFVVEVKYDNKRVKPEWQSATPIGNICVLCRYDNGFLIPEYDAINKLKSSRK